MAAKTTKRKAKLDDGVLAMLAEAWDSGRMNGDREGRSKDMAHSQTAKVLRYFAAEVMGLKPGQFEVRSNKGGVAVPGEVMLYVDKVGDAGVGLFVQIGSPVAGKSVMYRTSEGKDAKGRYDSGSGTQHRNQYAEFGDAFGSDEKMRWFYRDSIVPMLYVPHDDGTGLYYPQIGETVKDGRKG